MHARTENMATMYVLCLRDTVGSPAVSRKQSYPESHITNPLLTTFARSRWLDIVPSKLNLRTDGNTHNVADEKKIKRYCGCIGASPLPV